MFSIKDITIKQGAKGEYKVLQGAIQTPEYNDPKLYNVNVCIFKDDPDYDIVEAGKVLKRTLTKNTAGYWNFDKKDDGVVFMNRELGAVAQVATTDKEKTRTQDQNMQLIISQQKSLWEALRRIGEHLDIEWFKGNKDIRDHYHNMLSDIPEGEPLI